MSKGKLKLVLRVCFLGVGLVCQGASAQTMPTFDTKAYCDQAFAIYKNKEGMDFLLRSCLESEKKFRDEAHVLWEFLSPDERAECTNTGKSLVGGSFMMLQGCVSLHVLPKIYDGRLKIVRP